MTFDKFTIKAQEAVQEAVNTAQQNAQQSIEPVHLLKGVMVKAKDVAGYIFQKLGANASQIEMVVDSEIKRVETASRETINPAAVAERHETSEEL